MIDFRGAPSEDVARPLLTVWLEPDRYVPQLCLVDSGAPGIRMSADGARQAGVVLPHDPGSQVFEIEQDLTIVLDGEPVTWTAPVAFCDPWPHPFGLLGLRGFFDTFDVDFRGAEGKFAVRRA